VALSEAGRSALQHLELAERFLTEGRGLIDKDPVQASEKLYKAAEEAVKAIAIALDLMRLGRPWREVGGRCLY